MACSMPFASDDARGLEDEPIRVRQADFAAHLAVVIVQAGRGRLEIEDVRDDRGGEAATAGEFFLRHRVDDHVLHTGHRTGERGAQIIIHRTDDEAFAFPREVVMMRDGGQAGFRDELGHGEAERHVHRDRQDVLRDQHIDLEFLDEPVEFILQRLLEGLDFIGHFAGARGDAKQTGLECRHLGVIEEGEFREMAFGGWGVQQARHPETLVAHRFQDGGPFAGFEGNAVRTVKAGGDKADAARLARGGKEITHNGSDPERASAFDPELGFQSG